MGKYIVEVDESEIVECWNEQAAKELGYQEYALRQCPEIKVKPYNPAGDCISREVINSEIEKRYCSKRCVVPYEVPYCPDNCPARLLKNIVKECPSVPEKPQDKCCDSCYLCDVGNCDVKMQKGSTE